MAQSEPIYSEDFVGDGTLTIVGTPEDTAGTLWEGNSEFLNNGVVNLNRGSIGLPFSPQNGNTYTATVVMSNVAFNETMSFGFSEFLDPVRFHNQGGLTGWAFMYHIGEIGQDSFEGPRGLGDENIATGANEYSGTDPVKLEIILNTTAEVWTASYYVNDLVFAEAVELTNLGEGMGAGSINYISIASATNSTLGAKLDSFNLSVETSALPPALTEISPLDNQQGVALNIDLTASFDKTIQAGSSGNITLNRANDDSVVESFTVSSSDRLVFNGSSFSINPTFDFLSGVEYYITIPVGAITDPEGRSFPGITTKDDWSFTATSRSVSFIKITNDEDSGISSDLTYTHAIDFGRDPNIYDPSLVATVNGVEFVRDLGIGTTGAIARANSGTRNFGGSVNFGITPDLSVVTGDIANVLTDLRFKAPDPSTIELTGLTPGEFYDLRLYDRAYTFQEGTRRATLTYDINSDAVVDHTTPEFDTHDATAAPVSLDGDVAWATSFVYQAGPNGSITLTIGSNQDDVNDNYSYHLYGLTNQVAPSPTGLEISSITRSNGITPSVEIIFNSSPSASASYKIEASTNLEANSVPGGWVILDASYDSQGTQTSYIDTVYAIGSRAFYRVTRN